MKNKSTENNKRTSKSLFQKANLVFSKNKGFIIRMILFIFLALFTEWLIFNRISLNFQLSFNLVFLVFWIFIAEFFLSRNKMFQLHPKNYWAAFLTPLFFNIILNLFVYKYVNIFAISTILSTLIITLLI
ncbi:MAG: Metal dependent phosphohydrolase, partial [Petrotoga mobilis]